MEILEIVAKLESYSADERGFVKGDEQSVVMAAAAALLIGQGGKIVDLENKIAEMEAAERWIPVTEGMPPERESIIPGFGTVSKPVLVTWVDPTSDRHYPEDRFVRESATRNGEFRLTHINGDLVAVAWKPYPAPAKEE